MGVKLLPYFGELKKWGKISMREFAQKCKNPLLKQTFERMFWPEVSMLFILVALSFMHRKSAGYPLGASLNFSQKIADRYTQLGGKLHYRSKVRKILTENDNACGIELESGAIHQADIVISAADGHASIFEMLEGKYLDAQTRAYYENYEIFPSYLQISLGIARSFEHEPHTLAFPLEQTLFVDESSQWDTIGVRIFNFDPTLAPEGKTLVTSMLPTENYSYWEQLRRENPEKYQAEKDRIAIDIIGALDKRFGNVREHVEMIDVSTPATVIRYTNNWKGTFEGWVLSPKMGFRRMKKTLPGLSNFYMAGQWVEPGGGLPTALLSGRNVTQIICKEDKKRFVTTTA